MSGPFLLLDKSALRSLNLEEARALQKHFTVLITPLLLEELISDFTNPKLDGEEQLKTVLQTVAKANGMSMFSLHDTRLMIQANLLGSNIPLTQQIPRFGVKEVIGPDGSKGIVFEQSFEEKLLRNWSAGNFSQEDYEISGKLKQEFIEYDLPASQTEMRNQFPENTRFKSLSEVANFIDATDSIHGKQWSLIECLMNWAQMTIVKQQKVKSRWLAAGQPPIKTFAPYAFYCNRVLNIYFIAVTAGLVPVGKNDKSLIDILYFMYLPFAHEFASGDKFHRDLFPFFAKNDQGFIWSPDLKSDLNKIATFHKNLDEENRRNYERHFCHYPPPIPNSLTQAIWARHFGPWEPERFGNKAIDLSPEEQESTLAWLKKFN